MCNSDSDMNEEWKEEETDELFQLHTEYAGQDDMLDCVMERLQANGIYKDKKQVRKN